MCLQGLCVCGVGNINSLQNIQTIQTHTHTHTHKHKKKQSLHANPWYNCRNHGKYGCHKISKCHNIISFEFVISLAKPNSNEQKHTKCMPCYVANIYLRMCVFFICFFFVIQQNQKKICVEKYQTKNKT